MKKFLSQFLIYGCASMLSKIAAVFLMPLYTSVLPKADYGAMAMILACSGVLSMLANLNIHSGIARDYYEPDVDRKRLVSTGFFSILLCSVMIFMVFFMSRHSWTRMLGLESYSKAFLLMLLDIPTCSLLAYFSILTRYKNKPVLFLIGSVSQLAIQISIAVYLVLKRNAGIDGIFFATLLANLYGTLFFMIVNWEFLGWTFDMNVLKRTLAFALPTLPSVLVWWFDTSFGQMLIGKYVSLDDLGVYSISLSITSVFSLITVAFNNVWGPYLYENYKNDGFNAEVRRLYVLFLFFLITISVNLSLLANEIVLLLAQPTYIEAVRYITLLCLPLSVYMLLPFVTSGIGISRKTKYLSYASCTGSLINILMLMVFLPKYGVIVAPLSLAVSRLVNYFMSVYYSNKSVKFDFPHQWILVLTVIIMICYVINRLDFSRVLVWSMLLVFDMAAVLFFVKKTKKYNILQLIKHN